jgi:hypothetical protein
MAADYGLDNPDSLFDGPNRDSLVFKGVNYRNAKILPGPPASPSLFHGHFALQNYRATPRVSFSNSAKRPQRAKSVEY